jgi:hypothetical protein
MVLVFLVLFVPWGPRGVMVGGFFSMLLKDPGIEIRAAVLSSRAFASGIHP